MRKRTNQRNRNKGFSLVELIVVIAIMAVLVGVLAPQFIGYVAKSRQATDVQNAQTLAGEIGVKIANAEAGEDTFTYTPDAWQEVTTAVVSAVPAVKNKGAANGNGKFCYMVDKEDIVHIAVAEASGGASGAAITVNVDKGQLYPTFGKDTIGTGNWYDRIKE